MNDALDEGFEFRGGTLQLSAENNGTENAGTCGSNNEQNKVKKTGNADPSVLSGADSLSSSSLSYAGNPSRRVLKACQSLASSVKILLPLNFKIGARPEQETLSEPEVSPNREPESLHPRHDAPFNRESIKNYFTFRKGVVENAIQDCITGLLFPEDGEYLGSWLLTQITLWDNEKERIVLLTSRLVMTIKYDFIAMKQLDFKKTYLDDLDTIVIGDLVYPPSSIVPRLNGIASGVTTVVKDCVVERLCRRPSTTDTEAKLFEPKYFDPRERNLHGVRLMWNKGEQIPLKTLWNPFSQDVPFITFTSHPIYWHKDDDVEDKAIYDVCNFTQKLQSAVEALSSSECCIHHAPIVIQSYVGISSFVHNKTGLGFFKVRGKFSF